MTKLETLIDQLCPEGVEWKALGDIGSFIRGNGLQKKDFADVGIGCIHYGQIYTQYKLFTSKTISFVSPLLASKLKQAKTGDLIIATTSENDDDVCKAVAWLGGSPICVSGDSYIFTHNQNPKYIAYLFQTSLFFDYKKKAITGTKVKRVHGDSMKKFLFPIPPLAVQEEIVKILDNFTELTAELQELLAAELSARKKQYEYYRGKLLTFGDGVEWKALGEIGRVAMCKRIMKAETTSTGEVPFYKIGTFGKQADAYITEEKFLEYKKKYSFPQKGDILISAAGTIGRTVTYDGNPAYYQDSNIVWLEHNESIMLNTFLRYYYQLSPWNASIGGTISRLYNDDIRKIKIPIPPLAEQERIVNILDRFDALCHNLTSGLPAEIAARQKQYEYYRDKLLSFNEKE